MSLALAVRLNRRLRSAAAAAAAAVGWCVSVLCTGVSAVCTGLVDAARGVSARIRALGGSPPAANVERDEILRFRKSERYLHWAVAVPFMVSYTSALILVAVYNLNPTRPYRDVFSWIHRLSGVYLAILPLWTIVRHRHDLAIHFRNVRHAWTWSVDDVKWLLLMPASNVIRSISLPHQGKFNAAEKINFMVLVTTYPIYIITGVLIWLPGAALVPWLLHFSMAVMATPLMMGHIFMATINPETRVGLTGMITGFVSREWAKHHYRLWYDEHYGHEEEIATRTGGEEGESSGASGTLPSAPSGDLPVPETP